jgi:hypothetical protein
VTEKRRSERRVRETMSTFENFINPFDMRDKESLACISSGAISTPEITRDTLRAEKAGGEAMKASSVTDCKRALDSLTRSNC